LKTASAFSIQCLLRSQSPIYSPTFASINDIILCHFLRLRIQVDIGKLFRAKSLLS
jgi:hypothetical protein